MLELPTGQVYSSGTDHRHDASEPVTCDGLVSEGSKSERRREATLRCFAASLDASSPLWAGSHFRRVYAEQPDTLSAASKRIAVHNAKVGAGDVATALSAPGRRGCPLIWNGSAADRASAHNLTTSEGWNAGQAQRNHRSHELALAQRLAR